LRSCQQSGRQLLACAWQVTEQIRILEIGKAYAAINFKVEPLFLQNRESA